MCSACALFFYPSFSSPNILLSMSLMFALCFSSLSNFPLLQGHVDVQLSRCVQSLRRRGSDVVDSKQDTRAEPMICDDDDEIVPQVDAIGKGNDDSTPWNIETGKQASIRIKASARQQPGWWITNKAHSHKIEYRTLATALLTLRLRACLSCVARLVTSQFYLLLL